MQTRGEEPSCESGEEEEEGQEGGGGPLRCRKCGRNASMFKRKHLPPSCRDAAILDLDVVLLTYGTTPCTESISAFTIRCFGCHPKFRSCQIVQKKSGPKGQSSGYSDEAKKFLADKKAAKVSAMFQLYENPPWRTHTSVEVICWIAAVFGTVVFILCL